MCCFDFSGSGNSGGEFVTLGYNESEDLKIIISMLKELGVKENIFLWGRSMGAATALYYYLKNSKDPIISGLILDSPYSDLRSLSLEIAQKSTKMPKFILKPIINSIEKSITKRAKFKFDDMDLLYLVQRKNKKNIPAYFITSSKDEVIEASHVEKLYKEWGKEGIIKYTNLKHNEVRGNIIIDGCVKFLKEIHQNSMRKTRRTNSFYEYNIAKELLNNSMCETSTSRIKMFKDKF